MPIYTVNVTTTNFAWYTTEADSPEDAIASAAAAGPRYFDRDNSTETYVLDTLMVEDEDGIEHDATPKAAS